MPAITIRNLDVSFKARLRVQAALNGHSMEEEARQLLSKGLAGAQGAQPVRLTVLAKSLFGPKHGVENLALPKRTAPRALPGWSE